MRCSKFRDSPSRKYYALSFFGIAMLSDVSAKPAVEALMTDRKSAPMKDRKDIGKVVFPIEKLMAARAAGSS